MNHTHHRKRQRYRARGLDPGGRGRDPRPRRPAPGSRRPRRAALPADADRDRRDLHRRRDRHLRAAGPLAEGAGAHLVGDRGAVQRGGEPAALRVLPQRGQGRRPRAQWLRWLGIAALGNGASWGLAGGVFFRSLSDEQQVFLAFLFAGMASVGIPVYAASWPIFALYAAGILRPVLLRAAHLRQSAVRRDRAAGAALLRDQRRHRLPPDAGIPFRLPAAPCLRQADRGPPPAEPAPGKAAGRARGSAPPGRGERPQARPVRRARADRGARAAARTARWPR